MNIAIVNKFFFFKGGQETVALDQMKLLENAGHNVAFFSMHHPKNIQNYVWSKYFCDYADFSLQGNTLRMSEKLKLGYRFITNKHASSRFNAFLGEFKPDIIHCHGIAHQLTYSILPVAKKHGIPVVQTLHDYQLICPSYTLLQGHNSICQNECNKRNYLPCIRNRCVKNSFSASLLSAMEMVYNRTLFDYTQHIEIFISPSQFLAEQIIRSGISRDKVRTLSNFLTDIDVNVPKFQHQGYYTYIGRLSYEKGLFTLIDAFQLTPEARLCIAGDGPMKEQLMSYILEKDIQNIKFLGHLDRIEVDELLSNAMACIIPSEWYENQPMTIIEAFSHGKPVIGSNIGGIPEMVIDGVNGYLFTPGNSKELAAILRRLLDGQDELELLGKTAHSYAINHYHSQKHLTELTNLYASLIR